MAKKANAEVAEAMETTTSENGEVVEKAPRTPKVLPTAPKEDCVQGHGPEVQKLTPKGVQYCAKCYRENRKAREAKQVEEAMAAKAEFQALAGSDPGVTVKTTEEQAAEDAEVLEDAEV
jgi:hypothetical protein